jgi:GrpB-like predicted nucleotidyltransferase (UPF0157 family)
MKVLAKEQFAIVPYDPQWPARYAEVEGQLKRMLPRMLAQRITHIGSTAVPGLSAKSIIDVQVEVSSVELVKRDVLPVMEAAGYEFVWRPSMGDDAPFYAWFILRNAAGERTVHVHMVEPGQASVDRIIFRDHLRNHPEEAEAYEALKKDLAKRHPKDRTAYTLSKSSYIKEVLVKARSVKMRK